MSTPRLSVIIPAYNESSTILKLIERVRAVAIDKEIIIVDDCSRDGTSEVLKSVEGTPGLRVIRHEANRGKGAALRTGIRASSGEIVIIQDADLEYNPTEYPRLMEPIESGVADVVYGSRFSGGDRRRVLYFWHSVGNRVLTLCSNIFTNINLSDMETCYKVFKGEIIRSIEIEEDRFGFEPEITAKVARRRCRIYEIGISYEGRTYEEGKKIGWRDGVAALWCIIKYNILK